MIQSPVFTACSHSTFITLIKKNVFHVMMIKYMIRIFIHVKKEILFMYRIILVDY